MGPYRLVYFLTWSPHLLATFPKEGLLIHRNPFLSLSSLVEPPQQDPANLDIVRHLFSSKSPPTPAMKYFDTALLTNYVFYGKVELGRVTRSSFYLLSVAGSALAD